MMKRYIPWLTAAVAFLPLSLAVAKPKTNVLCALNSVHQCEADQGCEQVAPELVGIQSRFVEVDFKKGVMRGRRTGRQTSFTFSETPGGRWVLQGTEGNEEGDLGGVGYVMTIDPETADFSMSVASSDLILGIFGSCTNL